MPSASLPNEPRLVLSAKTPRPQTGAELRKSGEVSYRAASGEQLAEAAHPMPKVGACNADIMASSERNGANELRLAQTAAFALARPWGGHEEDNT